MKQIEILDTTLRDGSQMHGISFSVEDKIKIIKKLDEFGISYIEAGNPRANPKEKEFFKEMEKVKLKNAKLVAFGSTKKPNSRVEEDANLLDLVNANTNYVSIFGKAWDFHVKEVLETTLEENLNMIKQSIEYLKQKGKKVFFDAEHFYDGFKENKEYTKQVIKTAIQAGANKIILCDTIGGCLPEEIYDITKEMIEENLNASFGIHAHNDMGLAVANSLVVVDLGITQIQGTINGFGERCGNTNLCSLIPTLELKKDIRCLKKKEDLEQITKVSKYVYQVANMKANNNLPYVGEYAFTHKAGTHIDAMNKNIRTCEHISPKRVGNERRKLVSELAGKSAILEYMKKYIPKVTKEDEKVLYIINKIKELEKDGYQFEDADATLELIITKEYGIYKPIFEMLDLKVMIDKTDQEENTAVAIVEMMIENEYRLTSARGDGPVSALNNALISAIIKSYPELKNLELIDYKVRTIDSNKTKTESKVIVQIQSSDKNKKWGTVGVSTDIVRASYDALVDSIEYMFMENKIIKKKRREENV